jgi:hypothetical protein
MPAYVVWASCVHTDRAGVVCGKRCRVTPEGVCWRCRPAHARQEVRAVCTREGCDARTRSGTGLCSDACGRSRVLTQRWRGRAHDAANYMTEKRARTYYVGYTVAILDHAEEDGTRRADFVLCEGPCERYRHKMVAVVGRHGSYNLVALDRERFVPGGVHVMERVEL